MTILIRNVHENSEKFLPAFARASAPKDGQKGSYPPLDFHYNGPHPAPSPGEREIKRWVALAGCTFTTDENGLPLPPGASTGTLCKLFYGGAEIVLTDRRLLAMVLQADSILGKVDASNAVLLASFPLAEIHSIGVRSKKRLFGGMKETDVNIYYMSGAVAHLRLEDILAEPGGNPKGYQRYRGTMRGILESFVAPVVAARKGGSPGGNTQHLDEVEAGKREVIEDELTVTF